MFDLSEMWNIISNKKLLDFRRQKNEILCM